MHALSSKCLELLLLTIIEIVKDGSNMIVADLNSPDFVDYQIIAHPYPRVVGQRMSEKDLRSWQPDDQSVTERIQ